MKIDPNEPVYPMLEPSSIEGLYSLRSRGMTIRTQACIQLRIPKTGEPWLDDLIREARRQDHAAMAMQGFLSNNGVEMDGNDLAQVSVQFADALINELNKDQTDAH